MMNLMIGVVVDNFSHTSTQQDMLVSETCMLEARALPPAA